MWGIWMTWDEYKPCFPGTDQHDRSIGKWYAAGGEFQTDHGAPVLFECLVSALMHAQVTRENRRNAHPPFVLITPKKYEPTSSGEVIGCNVPDLSGLNGLRFRVDLGEGG